MALAAKASGDSKAAAERAVTIFITSICESLHRGKRVTISGFGTFVVARRVARNGRDPRTGNEIRLPACRVPRFRPSPVLKGALRCGILWVASGSWWGIV